MPVIEVQALSRPTDLEVFLGDVCSAVANALDASPGSVWCQYRPMEPGCWYEGERVRGAGDAQSASPIVTIRAFEGRSPQQKRDCLLAVARSVGEGLRVDPQDVFVEYQEIRSGHVCTGGAVR